MNSTVKICRPCLETICGNDFNAIDKFTEKMFNKLLLTIDLSIIEEPLMCEKCAVNVDKAVNFKSTCLNAENLSWGEIKSEKDKVVHKDHKSCRFCMTDSKTEGFAYFNETEENVFIAVVIQNHIPELKFNLAQQVITCTSCLVALQNLSRFIMKCLDVEHNVRKYAACFNEVPGQINLHDIQQLISEPLIKCEDSCSDENSSESLCQRETERFIGIQYLEPILRGHFSVNTPTNEDTNKADTVEIEETLLEEIKNEVKFNREHLKEKFCDDEEFVDEQKCNDELQCISENLLTNSKKAKMEETLLEEITCKIDLESEHLSEKFYGEKVVVDKQECNNDPPCISESTAKGDGKNAKTVQIDEILVGVIGSKIELESDYLNDKIDVEEHKFTDELPYISENISTDEDVEEEDNQQFVDESKFTVEGKGVHRSCVPETRQSHCQKDVLPDTDTNINLLKMDECSLRQPHKSILQVLLVRFDERIINEPLNPKLHKNMPEKKVHQHSPKCKSRLARRELNLENPPQTHQCDCFSNISMYRCEHCLFQTKRKRGLKMHFLTHKNPSEINMYKCAHCSYQTKRKESLIRHLLNHKNPSEINMYRCEHCSYQTRHRNNIINHLKGHGNLSERNIHQCAYCSYQTGQKNCLKSHLLTHKNPSEVNVQCELCSYQTKHKHQLNKHLLIHKNSSEINMYRCEHCSYQAKRKRDLEMHLLRHKNPSEINMYRCARCLFQTKRKESLIRHMLTHKKPSEINMYRCEHCSHQTKHKESLIRHMLTHKKPSEINMYRCEHCSHQTKHKESLIRHMLNHKKPSEINMYRCAHCSYQTKHRDNLIIHLKGHRYIHQCEHCSHQAKRKADLKKHLLIHMNRSKITMHRCKHCSFQTKHKISLKKHLLTHGLYTLKGVGASRSILV